MSEDSPSVKICVVGAHCIGKTSLCWTLDRGVYRDSGLPTVYENFSKTLLFPNETNVVHVSLWDCGWGAEDYPELPSMTYFFADTDVFLLCFCVSDRRTLDWSLRREYGAYSLIEEAISGVERYLPATGEKGEFFRGKAPNAKVILVGMRDDLRSDPTSGGKFIPDPEAVPVSPAEGEELARELKAWAYVECSSRHSGFTKDGCPMALSPDELVVECLRWHFRGERKKGRRCVVS